MRKDIVHFNDDNARQLFYDNYTFYGMTNDSSRSKMKKILFKAINTELTAKQKKCIMDYYFLNKKEKDIAAELSVHPSTVSRHISLAKKKLRHIASYYM